MNNARRLAKKEEKWKKVFVSPDLTWQQREDGRKRENKLKAEAEEKTENAKNKRKRGKFIVVGQRGRKRIVWSEDKKNKMEEYTASSQRSPLIYYKYGSGVYPCFREITTPILC